MPVSSSTEHWIKPDALTINLNHFGDPDYLQVSVLAGAVVMAFKQDVIGYNAAHNYRTWSLEAANTYLETSSAYNVYARLTRSEVNARALVVYDSILRDIEGREITYAENGSEVLGNADADYFFIFLGRISSNIDSNGQIIQREWIVDFRFGNLDTNQQKNDKVGLLDLMFRPHYENPLDPNEITWIEALTHLGVAGGITMYANGGLLNIPSIYDGLPIDSQTIYWDDVKDSNGVVVGKILKAKTGGGGGSGGSADFSNVRSTGSGNAYTSFILSDDKKTLTFVKSEKFALSSELESKWTADEGLINNWNTAFGWGNHSKAGYAEKNYVNSTFVTIAGSEDITGVHDFVNGLKINGNPITYNKEKDCWKLEGNLIVTGGVTMYGDSDNYDISSIYDALPIDGQTIYWEAIRDDNGVVIGKVLKAQGGGGVADSVSWSNVYGKPTWLLDDKINYSEIEGTPNLSVYQLKITSDNKLDYSLIGNTPDLSLYQSKITSRNKLAYTLISGTPNLSKYQTKITSTNKLDYSLISGTPDLSVYALETDIPSLSGYATEQWVKDRGYATTDDLDSRINSLVDGAPAAYDTLKEIADVLQGNVNSIGDIITTLGTKANQSALDETNETVKTKWTKDDTKIGNWDTAFGWGNHANAGYYLAKNFTKENIKSKLGISDWALMPTKPSYKTSEVKEETNLYFTKERAINALSETLKNYLPLTGGTISGSFTVEQDLIANRVIVNGITLKESKDGVLYIDGNLVVRGGVTMYGDENADIPSILNSIPTAGYDNISARGMVAFNSNQFVINNGVVSAIQSGGCLDVDGLKSYLTQNGYATQDWVTSQNYLPTSSYTASDILSKIKEIDGSDSGLDSDLLDGYNESSFFRSSRGKISSDDLDTYFARNSGCYSVRFSDYSGSLTVLSNVNNGSVSSIELYAPHYNISYGLKLRFSVDSNRYTSWRDFAFTDSNVASATKLQTARTIWGQSFDGTGNVSGDLHLSNNAITDLSSKRILLSGASNLYFGTSDVNGYNTYVTGNSIALRYGSSSLVGFIINSSGNVGINTISPDKKLHVIGISKFESTSNIPVLVKSTGSVESSIAYYGKDNYRWVVGQGTANISNSFGIWSDTLKANAMTIRSSGNVGIGTTSPSYTLHVAGTAYISSNLLTGGGITMYSARVLKNVVDERGLSLRELSVIKPTRYTWKDKRDERLHIGGIADDIQQVLPEVVYRTPDGILTMDYGNAAFAIASSLIQPVISHEERIARLERENRELKEEVKRLKSA